MRFSRYLAFAAVVTIGFAAAGCGDDSDDGEETSGDGTEETQPTAPPETGDAASVTIVEPADGAEVTSPVTFTLQPEGVDIQPVDDWDGVEEGVGHFHVLVDYGGCYEVGQPIPTEAEDQGLYHFGTGTSEPEIEDLEPGEHEVCVQVADQEHNALDITSEIAITVTE